MKVIIFFDKSTFAEAGITKVRPKPDFLPKNLAASVMLG